MRAFSPLRDPEKRPNSDHCEQIRRLISAGSEVGSLQVIAAADLGLRRPSPGHAAQCLVNWASVVRIGRALARSGRYPEVFAHIDKEVLRDPPKAISRRRPTLALGDRTGDRQNQRAHYEGARNTHREAVPQQSKGRCCIKETEYYPIRSLKFTWCSICAENLAFLTQDDSGLILAKFSVARSR